MKILDQRRVAKIAAWCYLCLIFGTPDASACSYSSIPVKVGRNFAVRVVHLGKPLPGLQIELSTDPKKADEDSRPVLTLTTNENGFVTFRAIRPGSYYVDVGQPAFPLSVEVLVLGRPSKKPDSPLTFEWPQGEKTVSVQSASGLLNAQLKTDRSGFEDQVHPVFGPLGEARLTLMQAASGEVVESQVSSGSGAFSFHQVPAGLYALHIELPQAGTQRYRADDGYIPIEIDPLAKALSLDLTLSPGICGSLAYENKDESDSK